MLAALLGACTPEDELLTAEQLRDPAACAECHPDHYREWSGSMHAYAGVDPVFLAMNAKGQRETDGELGTFCVQCHAPMAVADGLAQDGDLSEVPEAQRGVTCAFCHLVTDVEGTHNNPLRVATDGVLRGPFADPLPTPAHASQGSGLHDREDPRSAALCGSCHDIVTPAGAHIERTYAEWQDSLFAKPVVGLQCSECHMNRRAGTAAADSGARKVHDHGFPGVDVALQPFPAEFPEEQDRQRALVQELLDDTVAAYLCVAPAASDDASSLAVVTLENVAAGHHFPSGATADRRVWVELSAWRGSELLFQTGVAPDAQTPIGAVSTEDDPDLWRIWSTLLDAEGAPTSDLWNAAALVPGPSLPAPTTLDPNSPAWLDTHVPKSFLFWGVPDRVEVAVKVEPIGRELLDELVASGDLDPAVRDAMPTFTLGPTAVTWTADVPVNSGSLACVPQPPPPAP
jgi:hypothetical protein